MADEIKDGGQAFPVKDHWVQHGMSLRDYFAGQALIGLLSASTDELNWHVQNTVNAAYRFADAMLAERGEDERQPKNAH